MADDVDLVTNGELAIGQLHDRNVGTSAWHFAPSDKYGPGTRPR
jgi:hypothetical protein